MEMLKDKTLFNREHINDIVIKYDSKLDSLYTSKIWEKILILRIQAEGFRPPSPQIFPRRPQFVRRLPPPRRISTQPFQNRLPSADPHFNFHRRTEPNFHHRFRQFPSSRRWYI